jgi:uncharacterized coiled-coil DUF342 family protein
MELNEIKGKVGEVIQEIQETKKDMKEAKKEIKEEIARGNKVATPVLSCNIS